MPDLITTDMFRPGGSGLEFIQQIRAITALQDTPIVMISGGATPKERQQVRRLGLRSTYFSLECKSQGKQTSGLNSPSLPK